MLDALLFGEDLQTLSCCLTLREHSPNGLQRRCDLFLAVPGDSPLLLLIDGSTSTGAAVPTNPRGKLFETLAASWSILVRLPPTELLTRFGEELRRSNANSSKRMFASAVCLRRCANSGDWLLAEAGDSKAFLYDGAVGKVVLPSGLPQPDHRTEGLLGTNGQNVRTSIVHPEVTQRLLFATDGAFHVLLRTGAATADGTLSGDVLTAFSDNNYMAEDDSTLVLFNPHIKKRRFP